MGTIWWQLNDCWPVTSWALVDSGGRRKPAWFALREAYRPRLLTIQPRGAALVVFVVNDSDQAWVADATMRRLTFAGDVLVGEAFTIDVVPRSIQSFVLPSTITSAGDPTAELIVVEAGEQRALWWFLPDLQLALQPPAVTVQAEKRVGDVLSIVVVAHNLIRDLTILAERIDSGAEADRQLLTLLPGEATTITITGAREITGARLLDAPALRSAHGAVATGVSRPSSDGAR